MLITYYLWFIYWHSRRRISEWQLY